MKAIYLNSFKIHILMLVVLAVSLTGCGGGGGGSSTNGGGTTTASLAWSAEAYIKASNAETNDWFGSSVAMDGDTMVVGVYKEDSNLITVTNGAGSSANNTSSDSGAVYVYKRTGNTWVQEAYLKASNADSSDWFGYSVAISGDTIVVGAINEDSNQTTITNGAAASGNNSLSQSGAAYVFKRTGSTWAEEAYLKAPNADTDDNFGYSVAIDGNTIVVGAYFEDSNQTTITNGASVIENNTALNSGAAYVFKRAGSTWIHEAYLKAPNAGTGDYFGGNVAIDTDTIVVGAYYEDSNQITITNGTSVIDNNSASDSGAAYVFKRTGSSWAHEAYLKAPNADMNDWFGHSVAIDGDTIVVGAYNEDSNVTDITNGTSASPNNTAPSTGAAYVFKRTGNNWAQEAYLKASNADNNDWFGFDVAIHADTIVVGAYNEDSNQITVTNGATASPNNSSGNSGAAFVFKRTGNNWAQEAYLKAPNSDALDNFGYSVALNANSIVVGAWDEDSSQVTITNGATASEDNSASAAGAAYVFKRQ